MAAKKTTGSNVSSVKLFNEKKLEWEPHQIEPRKATKKEEEIIQDIILISKKVQNLMEERHRLFTKLPKQKAMVCTVDTKYDEEEGEILRETKTFVVDFREWRSTKNEPLGFTKETKTTKAEAAVCKIDLNS